MTDLRARLLALADPGEEFRDFTRRLIPTRYEILGVRVPALRKLAVELAADPAADGYVARGVGEDPAYEEILLCGLVLAARSRKMPLETLFGRLDALIPLFDNWAHVDIIASSLKLFASRRDEALRHFLPLKRDEGEFTKRFFAVLLMDFFMDDTHVDATLRHLREIPQGQYYVDMAIAWALSVALIKHYEKTVPLFQTPVLSRFVHNKAIQKARESRRIPPAQRECLDTLKIR